MTHSITDIPHDSSSQHPAAPLRATALGLLQICESRAKSQAVRSVDASALVLEQGASLVEPSGLPGRPARPLLVHPSQLKNRAVGTLEGRASLIHALTHIEANAINLALDMVWRFDGLPEAFYRDWFQVAQEEALHFDLLENHLIALGYAYGDFPAHDGLWDMAAKTRNDVLARLALVPRTLEARGLDATPAIRNKLVSVGDLPAAKILDIILRDEIGHVSIGNRWYHYLCTQRALDPIATDAELARQYGAPAQKGPFNLTARRAAGFIEAELTALCGTPQLA